MTEDTHEHGAPPTAELSSAALAEWNQHVEHVLRGLAHALNNRAAALSAVIELSREPGDDAAVTTSILGTELERVSDLVSVVRSIGAPRHGMEAFAPGDAAAEALAVLKLHAERRDRVVSIDAISSPPIRVPRWMYVRSLIVLGADASTMTLAEEGDWLVTSADALNASSHQSSVFIAEMARLMGGEPLDGQRGFRVPTLAALRQREAR